MLLQDPWVPRVVFAILIGTLGTASFDRCIADDEWGDDFFDVVGTIDPSERPKSPNLDLPAELKDVSPWNDSEFPELAGWIRWLTLKNLPESYEDNRKWGKQKAVFERIDVDLDRFKLSAKKKYKYVNQGTWSRYFIEMVEPEKRLQVSISHFHQPKPSSIAFDVSLEADMHAFGRISQWQRDIQLVSLSANADVRARLTASCEVDFVMLPLKFPPDIEVRPKITKAHIELIDFRVRRISQVGGSIAHEIGKLLRKEVEEKLDDYDVRLVEKANKQIERQQQHLRLSPQDWIGTRLNSMISPHQSGEGQ